MTNGLFQAHLDTKDAEKAETYRKTKGISKSELVRQALDAYVKEEKPIRNYFHILYNDGKRYQR